MLRLARHAIVHSLWENYRNASQQMQILERSLEQKGISNPTLDHFALIDLPSNNSGIPVLRELFTNIGYTERGKGYLADKQNDFMWLAETESMTHPAQMALPQVVVADFRLHELPENIRAIIQHYAQFAPTAPLDIIRELVQRTNDNDESAMLMLVDTVLQYCKQRPWPLPTVAEFETVFAFNRLLAWVLIFGRSPNHFTLSLHHLNIFTDMANFHQYVEDELNLPLNAEGGKIKGTPDSGIMQGSTIGTFESVALQDGTIELPRGFVEFVWRFPLDQNTKPTKWNDYFTGFIAANADHVIKSLTTK